MSAPGPAGESGAGAGSGAKRGLLDAVMGLSVTGEVLADLERCLPAVPEGPEEEERALVYEVYSTQRAQLAALPRAVLSRVASGAPRGSEFWDALAPVRGVRFVGGGRGWSDEVVAALRALAIEVGPPGEGAAEAEEARANNAAGVGGAAAAA